MDLLLIAPWQVSLNKDVNLLQTLDGLQIPNPVTFITQKLLVHDKRRKEKKPQDVLYIHDTLELFGAQADLLTAIWKDEILPAYPEKDIKKALQARDEIFSEVTDTMREAARIPTDRILVPEDMHALCEELLNEILG